MKNPFTTLFWSVIFVVCSFLFVGCPPVDVDKKEVRTSVDQFRIDRNQPPKLEHQFGVNFTHEMTINNPGNLSTTVEIGGVETHSGGVIERDAKFDPYEGISWRIVQTPELLPASLTVTFNPAVCSSTQSSSVMTIHADSTAPNGTYTVTVQTNHATFTAPKSFFLKLTVNLPPIPSDSTPWIDVTPSSSLPHLNDVAFADAMNGVAVGDNGTIIRTSDSGLTWNTLASGTSNALRAIEFANSSRGYIVGSNIILKTDNGGNTWSQVDLPVESPEEPKEFQGLSILDAASFVVYDSKNNGSKLWSTSNAGENWQTIGVFAPIHDVIFTDSLHGIMSNVRVGAAYTVLRTTTDGGSTWQEDETRYSSGMYDMLYKGGRNFIACGGATSIYTSADNGVVWTTATVANADGNLLAISMSGNHGVAVGESGTAVRTTGSQWIPDNMSSPHNLKSVKVINNANAIAVGNGRRQDSGNAFVGVVMRRK